VLIPYIEHDGMWTLRDSEMVSLFEQFEEEGSIQYIFRSGEIHTPEDFIRTFKYGTNRLYISLIDDKIAAIVWLSDISGRRASIHFNALKWCWGKKVRDEGKYVLDTLSTVWDCLIGITPVDNPLACRFIKQIGMKPLGVMPNMVYDEGLNESIDALITSYSKEG